MSKYQVLFLTFFVLTNCQPPKPFSMSSIDKHKRDAVVKKYRLLEFRDLQEPVFMTLDEFFDGNNDVASIAPNLNYKPPISEYYRILKDLKKNDKVIDVLVHIKDVNTYEGGKLHDDEWFFSDMIYIVGDMGKEEVRATVKELLPDEVEDDQEGQVKKLNDKYTNKSIVYIWWD